MWNILPCRVSKGKLYACWENGNKTNSLFVHPPNKQKSHQKLWSTNISHSVWVPEPQAAKNLDLSSLFGCSIKMWCTAGHCWTEWVFSVTSCSQFHVHTLFFFINTSGKQKPMLIPCFSRKIYKHKKKQEIFKESFFKISVCYKTRFESWRMHIVLKGWQLWGCTIRC